MLPKAVLRRHEFVSLEDEAGSIKVIVRADVREAQRKPPLHARLLGVAWKWQVEDGVCK